MYINPFVAGILCTIGVELLVFMMLFLYYALRRKDNG